jgi:hypothetical protein
MTTDSQVEQLAAELVALPLAQFLAEIDARIAAVLGDVDRETAQAALDRAAEIMRHRAIASARHTESLEMVGRLANATRCPAGSSPVTWLEGLGLIERDNTGGYVKTPKATARVVRP